jgi:hypothetical protein
MCAEFTPRVFANLAIGNADDIGFGVAPHPVRCALRLELGSGKGLSGGQFHPSSHGADRGVLAEVRAHHEGIGRQVVGPKRKRVLDAINHLTPDRVPVDFGGSAVTGMHVSCVKLRDHYGLERRLVRVTEPFQMGHVYDKQSYGLV